MRPPWEQPWAVDVITCAYLSERSLPVIRCTAKAWLVERFSCLCAWLGPLWSLTIKKDKLVICPAVWQCTERAHKAEPQKNIWLVTAAYPRKFSMRISKQWWQTWCVTSWNFLKRKAWLILLAANSLYMMIKSRHNKTLRHLRSPQIMQF